jgi:hypothetical protein
MSDPAGKATTATDPDGETRSSQRDGGSSRERRSNVDPAGKAAAATDPTKARKGRATGRFQPGRGLRRTWQRVLTAPATGEARSGRRCVASAMTRDYTGKDADTKERGAARGGADIGKEGRCAGSRGRGCGGEQLGLPRRWRAAVLEGGRGSSRPSHSGRALRNRTMAGSRAGGARARATPAWQLLASPKARGLGQRPGLHAGAPARAAGGHARSRATGGAAHRQSPRRQGVTSGLPAPVPPRRCCCEDESRGERAGWEREEVAAGGAEEAAAVGAEGAAPGSRQEAARPRTASSSAWAWAGWRRSPPPCRWLGCGRPREGRDEPPGGRRRLVGVAAGSSASAGGCGVERKETLI